ncbi:MAG TPA: Crp/Fnr family transcriptional regulator [Pyrinomonadaceae bacterium]|jgi:CRP-like cAMP-binding protein|nr:Crp/Fnr family transcriptional regulator [Pyrinomonadaceae bacterium]
MPETNQPASDNSLLAALSGEDCERLAPHLEPVTLGLSQVLFRPEDRLRHVHFPTTSIVSLLTSLEDGSGMEVGLVGREGMVGISAFLGGAETKIATVQAAGEGFRLEVGKLQAEFARGGALQGALLRYTHALMIQVSQSVVCNARHPVEGRLARWLLMYYDRLGRDEFELTHEFMGNMLGVRRASVSGVAEKLQVMGFICYQRGHFTVLDRKGLEEFACECYPAVKEKFDDLLL